MLAPGAKAVFTTVVDGSASVQLAAIPQLG